MQGGAAAHLILDVGRTFQGKFSSVDNLSLGSFSVAHFLNALSPCVFVGFSPRARQKATKTHCDTESRGM